METKQAWSVPARCADKGALRRLKEFLDTVSLEPLGNVIIRSAISLLVSCPLFAQITTLDWKVHDVGRVRQVVTNMGTIWAASFNYPGLANYPGLINAEFPPNSNEEHVHEGGIRIGAIRGADTLVTTTSWNNAHINFEFYATASPDDTIWAVSRGDTVDIPYWPNYVAVSDQDLVCRYSDYNVTNISLHTPLYVDVIQASYAWSSPPLDKVIVYNYYVVPVRENLRETYIAFLLQGRVGDWGAGHGTDDDDVSSYYSEQKMGMIRDRPGGADGDARSPIAIKIYPPEERSASLKWSFTWYGDHNTMPTRDPQIYRDEMASGNILVDQATPEVEAIFIVSFGPINLAVGDTLHFVAVELLGDGLDDLLRTADRFDVLAKQEFKVPSAPPSPPLRIDVRSHEVKLSWTPQSADDNPEFYRDPYRGDGVEYPFEGYRVYKSTQSATGPWGLLAEYDLPNDIGFNTGLEYEFTDSGLLNNLDYYYTATSYSRPDSVLDFPTLESSLNRNARRVIPASQPPATVGQVAVVPNPYRGDISYSTYNPPWERPSGTRKQWLEQDRRIQFINLPGRCEIKIYTLAGVLVNTIKHDDPNKGHEDWNLTSSVGQGISSGIYLFTVEDSETGEVQVGKFVIIK